MSPMTIEVQDRLTHDYVTVKRRVTGALIATGAPLTEAEEHAHDAVVETYLGAHRVHDPSAVVAYGRTIAKRKHWSAQRQRQRTVPVQPTDLPDVVSPDTASVRLDRAAVVETMAAALATLSPRDREMLWERHVEGLSCEEIAARHGLSPASVPKTLLRARTRLRDLLQDSVL